MWVYGQFDHRNVWVSTNSGARKQDVPEADEHPHRPQPALTFDHQFNAQTLIIHPLVSRKFTSQNDLH